VKELPPDYQEEVRDFVIFLLEKRNKRPGHQPTFSWAGALKDLRAQYTSRDLQHQIAEERIPVLSRKKQQRLDLLLDRANEGKLTSQQSQELNQLIEEAQLLTLRKARLLANTFGKN
jgi:uncharacterized protein DUF2281